MTSLRIAAIGPNFENRWTIEGVLGGSDHWALAGETYLALGERIQSWFESELKDIQQSLDNTMNRAKPLDLPLLNRIIIGQLDDTSRAGWELGRLHCGQPGHIIAEQLHTVRREVSDFLLDLDPRHVCARVDWNPYVPLTYSLVEDSRLETVCFHHPGLLGPVAFIPVLGATNRNYINPQYNYTPGLPPSATTYQGYEGHRLLLDMVKGIWTPESGDLKGFADTKLELAGYGTPFQMVRPGGVHTRTPTKADGREVLQLFKALEVERTVGKALEDRFKAELDPRWHEAVKVLVWMRIPPCDACGWTTDDYSIT